MLCIIHLPGVTINQSVANQKQWKTDQLLNSVERGAKMGMSASAGMLCDGSGDDMPGETPAFIKQEGIPEMNALKTKLNELKMSYFMTLTVLCILVSKHLFIVCCDSLLHGGAVLNSQDKEDTASEDGGAS